VYNTAQNKIIIRLAARFQPNVGFTLRRVWRCSHLRP